MSHSDFITELVSIEWRDSVPISLILVADWQRCRDPQIVIDQVLATVSTHQSRGLGTKAIRLGDVELSELRQFNELLAAAHEESQRAVDSPIQEQQTEHFISTWRSGLLLSLSGDTNWMWNATRQEIVDEILDVITAPDPITVSPATSARDRLAAFIHGAA